MVRSKDSVMLTKDEYHTISGKALEKFMKAHEDDDPLFTMLGATSALAGMAIIGEMLFEEGEEEK